MIEQNWAIKIDRWIYKENLTRHEAEDIAHEVCKCINGVQMVKIICHSGGEDCE